ncbi:FtsX-like permease family protein, partial [Actinocorallia lasiicapitis]
FAAPGLADDTIVLDTSVRGVAAGDVLTLRPGGLRLTIAGFAPLGTLQHTAVGQVSLPTWQKARTRGGGTVGAFLVRGAASPAALAGAADGLEAVAKDEAVASVPGYAQETGTINLIRGFLLGIAALLIGTVFWIFTLQKEGSVAVLRATGASRRLLTSSYLTQVLLTTAAGLLAALGAVFAARGL